MKSIGYAITLIAVISITAFTGKNAIAHECEADPAAACHWTVDGAIFPDSDCDHVYDHDSNCNEYDNCMFARNGNCSSDPLDCDINNDGIASKLELAAGYQADWNRNGIGDACDDADEDGVFDYRDNCKTFSNPDQDPDACVDTDGDFFEDEIDNCPTRYNNPQDDTDDDGVGDACDICPFDANPRDENGEQDPSACPLPEDPDRGEIPNANPSEGQNPTGSTDMSDSNFKQGTGGCSMVAANSSTLPMATLLMTFSTLAIAVIRRKS